jgi:hypothetical protein
MRERERWAGRSAVMGFVIGGLMLAGVTGAWAAEDLRIEGEEYVFYGSYNIGGVEIRPEYCGSASEYYAADGIDVPGEWIKLKVTIPVTGCYELVSAYQAAYQDTVEIDVSILDYPEPGQVTSSRFTFVEGYGYG